MQVLCRETFRHWLEQQAHGNLVRELAHDAKEFTALPEASGFANSMSTVLLAELALAGRKAQTEFANPAEQFERLRELLHTVGRVRREDCLTSRLALDCDCQALKQAAEDLKAWSREAKPVNRQHPEPAKNSPNQGQSR